MLKRKTKCMYELCKLRARHILIYVDGKQLLKSYVCKHHLLEAEQKLMNLYKPKESKEPLIISPNAH